MQGAWGCARSLSAWTAIRELCDLQPQSRALPQSPSSAATTLLLPLLREILEKCSAFASHPSPCHATRPFQCKFPRAVFQFSTCFALPSSHHPCLEAALAQGTLCGCSHLFCWFSFHRSKAESGLLWMKPIPVRKPILHFSHPLRFGEHS